jgi:hypothetical protein
MGEMAGLVRSQLIGLLDSLGADADETALAAARELHRTVVESGQTWDDLLLSDESEPDDEVAPEEGEDRDEVVEPVGTDRQEDVAIIDGLLSRTDMFEFTRLELTDLKRGIAEGTFTEDDSRYLRALAKRLGSARVDRSDLRRRPTASNEA